MLTENSQSDFQDTPRDWARRWASEFSSARAEVKDWREQGLKIVARYRDEREWKKRGETRWNLFTTGVQTQMASLYGQTPKVSVTRRFADAGDDVARVAAEMLERLLNSDIEKDSDTFAQALEYALLDRLLPGFGLCRVRYVAEFEQVAEQAAQVDPLTGAVLVEAVEAYERKVYECVETDYCHWQDVLWSPARVWHEVRWVSFRAEMLEKAFNERFDPGGERGLWRRVPKMGKKEGTDEAKRCEPWDRAEVWEVWDKESRECFWLVEGYPEVLDRRPDPLGLDGFFPCPKPLLSLTTTDKIVPRPDFVMAQDFYNEIDLVSTRITLLERAIRVVGVYDKASAGSSIGRLLGEAAANELLPIDNWGGFAEKGGLRGVIDWLPLEQITTALTALRDYRRELVDALYQVTGMSDILRGQATTGGVTATEQAIKARFGSVRLQHLQDEVARFATDIQRLKSEVIAKHYDVESIVAQSNAEFSFDAQLAPQGAALLKERIAHYRIEVKPEAVSLQDFAALRNERMEMLSGVASFMQAMGPLVQQVPGSAPFMLQMLQWSVSGLRGSSTIEGVLDKAIQAAEAAQKKSEAESAANAGKPPEMDPKLLAQSMKGQQEMVKVQAELQADLTRIQAETQADAEREQTQALWNTREAAQKALISEAHRAMRPQGNGMKPGGEL